MSFLQRIFGTWSVVAMRLSVSRTRLNSRYLLFSLTRSDFQMRDTGVAVVY